MLLFNFLILTLCRVQVMKILIMLFSLFNLHIITLRPKYILSMPSIHWVPIQFTWWWKWPITNLCNNSGFIKTFSLLHSCATGYH